MALSEHEALVTRCVECSACRLRLHRRNAVIYRGTCPSSLMLIGEAPGIEEDSRGIPFIGPEGQLLDKLLLRAEVPADRIYLTNVVKCRPPGNRDPLPEEYRPCQQLLREQIRLVHPRRIVTVGKVATAVVTATRGPMGVLLDQGDLVCFWKPDIPVIPVYHPAYLLRRLDDPAVRVEIQDTIARLTQAWREAVP